MRDAGRVAAGRWAGAVAALAAVMMAASPALGQRGNQYEPPSDPEDAVKWVNNLLPAAPESERVEDVLLPALAGIEDAPAGLETIEQAALIAPGDDGWEAAAEWAAAEAQQKALEALREVTGDGRRRVYTLPYGDGAKQEYKDAGLWVELGDPPALARAKHHDMDAFDALMRLVNVEVTRLAEEGKVKEAVDLLVHGARLGRIIADRPFLAEKGWGLVFMGVALERLRDVVHSYMDGLSESELVEVLGNLEEEDFELNRLTLPEGDRIAALQIVAMTFTPRRGPDQDRFGPTLARLDAGERPLRLFGQAARWQKVAAHHSDWFDTLKKLEAVWEDWKLRWDFTAHDEWLASEQEFVKLDRARYAVLGEALPPVGMLLDLRLRLRTELAGTRLAIASVAHRKRHRDWPRPLFAVRGTYVRQIDVDPYDPDGEDPFQYFVPIRDQPQDARRDPEPHRILVIPEKPKSALPSVSAVRSMADERWAAAQQLDQFARRQLVEQTLRRLIDLGVTDANVGPLVDQWDALMATGGAAAAKPAGGLLPDDVAKEALSRALQKMMKSSGVSSALSKLRSNSFLSEDDVNAALRELVSVGAEAINEARRLAPPSEDSFTVELDESEFVLYSVGEDGEADWAKRVGSGGTDILIWPPVISLMREHTRESGG